MGIEDIAKTYAPPEYPYAIVERHKWSNSIEMTICKRDTNGKFHPIQTISGIKADSLHLYIWGKILTGCEGRWISRVCCDYDILYFRLMASDEVTIIPSLFNYVRKLEGEANPPSWVCTQDGIHFDAIASPKDPIIQFAHIDGTDHLRACLFLGDMDLYLQLTGRKAVKALPYRNGSIPMPANPFPPLAQLVKEA